MKKQRSTSKNQSLWRQAQNESLSKASPRATDQKQPPKAEARQAIAGWTPTPRAQRVIDTCQAVFDDVPGARSDCNGFVKSVCNKLNANPFSDADNADAITNHIRDIGWCAHNGWTPLDRDPQKAKDSAQRGELIVGGATGTDLKQAHGHVVLVVDSKGLWKGYPYASWGKLGGVGRTNARMTVAYKLADLPKVSYMTKKV